MENSFAEEWFQLKYGDDHKELSECAHSCHGGLQISGEIWLFLQESANNPSGDWHLVEWRLYSEFPVRVQWLWGCLDVVGGKYENNRQMLHRNYRGKIVSILCSSSPEKTFLREWIWEELARILKLINKICNFRTVALPDQIGLAIKLNECTEIKINITVCTMTAEVKLK